MWKVSFFIEGTSNISNWSSLWSCSVFQRRTFQSTGWWWWGVSSKARERTNSHTVQHADLPLIHSPSTILGVPKSNIVLIQFPQRKKNVSFTGGQWNIADRLGGKSGDPFYKQTSYQCPLSSQVSGLKAMGLSTSEGWMFWGSAEWISPHYRPLACDFLFLLSQYHSSLFVLFKNWKTL